MNTRLVVSTFSSKLHPCPKNLRQLSIQCSTVSPNPSNNNGEGGSSSNSNGRSKETNSPTNLSIRYRARSKRQKAKQEKQRQEEEDGGLQKEGKVSKKWEEMKLSEKALELYLGEKGLLFWLNKLAYASIFAVIGGWILFRFVGPSLGLYQLDSSAPLSPTSLFKNG